MYVAIVLTDESHDKLVSMFSNMWDTRVWETIAHHMTVHMGKATGEENMLLGSYQTLLIDSVAFDEKVVAVGVSKDSIPDEILKNVVNKTPHITLAVNRQRGGKPFLSNNLTNWKSIPEPILLRGRFDEVHS